MYLGYCLLRSQACDQAPSAPLQLFEASSDPCNLLCSYQARLQQNLMFLAAIADAQPQAPPPPPPVSHLFLDVLPLLSCLLCAMFCKFFSFPTADYLMGHCITTLGATNTNQSTDGILRCSLQKFQNGRPQLANYLPLVCYP